MQEKQMCVVTRQAINISVVFNCTQPIQVEQVGGVVLHLAFVGYVDG